MKRAGYSRAFFPKPGDTEAEPCRVISSKPDSCLGSLILKHLSLSLASFLLLGSLLGRRLLAASCEDLLTSALNVFLELQLPTDAVYLSQLSVCSPWVLSHPKCPRKEEDGSPSLLTMPVGFHSLPRRFLF